MNTIQTSSEAGGGFVQKTSSVSKANAGKQPEFVRHCANRRLNTEAVLNYLRTRSAEAIRSCRGCRQVGLAGRFARTQARSGQSALGFGLPLESAARRLAASVRQFQPVRHPSRRPARQVSLLFPRRPSTRLKPQSFILALALSVKLSVEANANSQKFWRFNPNSL